MWTELAKDLVIKEAIVEMDYRYEETDNFFYIVEYLQYVSRTHSAWQIVTDGRYRKTSSDWWSCQKRYDRNERND